MSSEWKTFQLNDVGRIVTGKTPKGGIPEYEGDDVPFVSPPDFAGNKWITATVRFISEAGAQSVKGSLLQPRNVLVTCIGSDMGKSAIAGSRCVTNQQINALVVDESKFCPEFLYYNLAQRKEEIRSLAGGSAQPILNKSAFGLITFEAPELEMQKLISATLRPLDDRITLLRETNTTLEAIAQALFKSWFVDFDPVHAKMQGRAPEGMDEATAALFPDSFGESELGTVPKGWKLGPLSDLCVIASGKRPVDRSDVLSDSSNIPLYGGAGVMGFTSELLFEDKKIVTGRVGTLGRVHVAYPPFWASDNVLVLSPRDETFFSFSFQWLSGIDIHALNRGSTQPLLTQKDLGAQVNVIPPQTLLEKFEEISAVLNQQIRLQTLQVETLSNLRDTLLPRLISGELRTSSIAGDAA